MPSSSSSMRKKATGSTNATIGTNVSRPSLIDTMLLTSTPLRRSPAVQSTATSTRSATNLTLQSVFKEKNHTYEDMQLMNLTKNLNKKEKKSTPINKNLRKRSKNRRNLAVEEEDDDDETENDQVIQTRRKPLINKRKTILSKPQPTDEPIAKKLRRTAAASTQKRTIKNAIRKSSAGSSEGCTTVDEENEEARLIQQSKLYIEGPGIRSNYEKINEHNARIGEKIQNLRSHKTTLPSPILSQSTHGKQDIIVASAQTNSPIKIKTASRITFALPPQSVSPTPTHIYDSIHPPSPQMPPTTTAISIETQTDPFSFSSIQHEKQAQTDFIEISNQTIQTDSINSQLISTATQYQSDQISEQHIICRDLTTCTCVEQLVKTRQFLVDVTNKLQLPTINRTIKVSKQTMTADESSPSTMVLAKSSLKAEQQIIFEQFIAQFNIRYSNVVDESTTHLITDSLDENTPLVCPLTLKVIQATARHLPIISIQWLIASLTHQIIVPFQIYEIFLGDPTYGYHGGFLRSRIPRSQGLFQGIAFRLECPEEHGFPAILADNRALRELIHLCGGIIIDESNLNHSSTVIVLCNQLKRKEQMIYTAYVKPEWLLASIAQFNLQPFQQFSVHFSS